MKGRHLNHSAGPGRKLAGDTVAFELPSATVGGGQSDKEVFWPSCGRCNQHELPRVTLRLGLSSSHRPATDLGGRGDGVLVGRERPPPPAAL